MKIGLLKTKESRFLALKNLLLWEGIEFEEIKKAQNSFAVIVSLKPVKCSCWNISFSKEEKTIAGQRRLLLDERVLESAENAFSFRKNSIEVSGSEIFRALDFIAKSLGKQFETKWYFPVEKEFAAMVSHDIDFEANYKNLFLKNAALAKVFSRLPKALVAKAFRKIPRKERYAFFPSVLSFDEVFGFKATVFLRAESFMKEESLTKRGKYCVDEKVNGLRHNAGVHFGATLGNYSEGTVRTDVYESAVFPWIEGVKQSKKELEEFFGPKGCRTHHHHFFVPWTLEAIEKAGFLYDSSLFPELWVHFERKFSELKERKDCWKPYSNCRIAFHPLPGRESKEFKFFELPVTVMECHERQKIIESVSESKRINGIANALYHPSVDVRGLVWFLEECKAQDAWITTMEEFAQWLAKREKMPLSKAPVKRIAGKVKNFKGLKKIGDYWLKD